MPDPTGSILEALQFAAHKHRDQRRKDPQASPYINHPIALANVLWREGRVRSAAVIQAALLHDTVEDTETSAAELRKRFGRKVASIVMEVSDDKSLLKPERKRRQVEHAPHLSREAKLVKLADKICNLRDMAEAAPRTWPRSRVREYFDWSRRVVDGLRGVHPTLERIFDHAYSRKP